jgi:Ni/Co efflux regulator RcnB
MGSWGGPAAAVQLSLSQLASSWRHVSCRDVQSIHPREFTMKRTVLAAMVLSLLTGSVALADPPQGYDHHDHDQRHDRRHEEHHDRREDRRDEHRRDEDRGRPMRAHEYFDSGRYVRPHGYYARHWHRGDRLPPTYRSEAYVIPNPVVYRLRPAPAGYYWVRVDNNAVLAAVATGVVVSVAVNLFH